MVEYLYLKFRKMAMYDTIYVLLFCLYIIISSMYFILGVEYNFFRCNIHHFYVKISMKLAIIKIKTLNWYIKNKFLDNGCIYSSSITIYKFLLIVLLSFGSMKIYKYLIKEIK